MGAKWCDPPGSKYMFDKLGDPIASIYMFPDQGHIVEV